MVKLQFSIAIEYVIGAANCDFIFNIHAAQTSCQKILRENISASQSKLSAVYTDPSSQNRTVRIQCNAGTLAIKYDALVAITHGKVPGNQLMEMPIAQLPPQVLTYLYPSRYCQSDRLYKFAMSEFGHLARGYSRVQAIQRWVQRYITFLPHATTTSTSAIDTLTERVGVCRDFAHLMIALCRALNIPARFTTGIDYGANPALGPPDFHAYVEVYLSGGWYLVDPSGLAMPMGLVRFGVGRDAADVAFATLFGPVKPATPLISISAVVDGAGCITPFHTEDALSTDSC